MEIPEQYPPRKPNFMLVVTLFAVSIVVILLAAVWFVHGKSLRKLPHGSADSMTQPATELWLA